MAIQQIHSLKKEMISARFSVNLRLFVIAKTRRP